MYYIKNKDTDVVLQHTPLENIYTRQPYGSSLNIEESAALKNYGLSHAKYICICILKKGKWNNQSGHYSNH